MNLSTVAVAEKFMGDKTIGEVIDENLQDSVKTYVHTYGY